MRRYAIYAALLIVLVLALAASSIFFNDSRNRRTPGGPKSPASAASPASTEIPSAWLLLTAEDLQELAGDEYHPREAQTEIATIKQCAYGGAHDVTLTIVAGSGSALRYQSIEYYPDHASESNLGDAAIWVPSRGILAVRHGDIALQIEVSGGALIDDENAGADDERLELARAIADHVLEQLSNSTP